MFTFWVKRALTLAGVTKDLFMSFWEVAFQTYFDGDVMKVPLVSPQKLANKPRIQALGRVLKHGWRLTGELPVRFCEATIIAVLHAEDAVPNEALERLFLWYISEFEREVRCSVLEGGRYMITRGRLCLAFTIDSQCNVFLQHHKMNFASTYSLWRDANSSSYRWQLCHT